MARHKSVWIDIVGGALIVTACGIGGWALLATANAPRVYATKTEVKGDVKEVKEDAQKDRDQIRTDIQTGFENVNREQRSLRRSIEDLNKFLREHVIH